MGAWDNGSQTGIQVNNKAHEAVVQMGDVESGDYVFQGLAVLENGRNIGGIRAEPGRGGVVFAQIPGGASKAELTPYRGYDFFQSGKLRINLGLGDQRNPALRFIAAGDQPVAGLGEAADGSGGRLIIKDGAGKDAIKAAIAQGQGGQVVVYGTSGGQAGMATKGGVDSVFAGPPEEPAALLGQSETTAGAGHLALAAPGGASAVQAGYQGNIGLVVTYAQGKPAGILSPGLKVPGFTAGANW